MACGGPLCNCVVGGLTAPADWISDVDCYTAIHAREKRALVKAPIAAGLALAAAGAGAALGSLARSDRGPLYGAGAAVALNALGWWIYASVRAKKNAEES